MNGGKRPARGRLRPTIAGTGTLLVVDDDELNRDMLSRRLTKEGYRVLVAKNGTIALAVVAESAVDLVILDVMMPGLSGLEVLEILRKSHTTTELPVIMATAKDESRDIVEALELGANDYVTKPLDFPVVMARIETQLSMKRAMDQIRELERSLAEQNSVLEAANGRMQRDLRSAAKVQATFLPRDVPSLPGLALEWTFRPCDELAGDGLGIVQLDETHVALYVLDVSGHGVASAMLSVSVARVLSSPTDESSILVRTVSDGNQQVRRPVAPGEVADRLNQLFPFDLVTGQYFTLSYGVLNCATGEYTYASAGHPGPVHVPANGEPVVLEGRGFPIGIAEDAYVEHRLMLEPGDRLVLYSDGVPEASSPEGEMFGFGRLLQTLERGRLQSLGTTVTGLRTDVEGWTGGKGLQDDLSILALETGARSERGAR
jgi:sigma-B regulation protein RsbU (phosphoserine phosphatase)